jgi:dipeptidyl aminopeptidase/acylaminoacyl peptidase
MTACHIGPSRRTRITAMGGLLALFGLGSDAALASAQEPGPQPLSKMSREALALAHARASNQAMTMIAAAPGSAAEVSAHVRQIGGEVLREEHDIDYVRALVPLAEVHGLAGHPRVAALDLASSWSDRLVYDQVGDTGLALVAPASPKATAGPVPDTAMSDPPAPGPNTPADNPYMPIRDMHATHFRTAYPTFDGRGVTIAVLDSDLPDILTPELATALDLDGHEVPKIADLLTATDPRAGTDPMWVQMTITVDAVDGVFEHEDWSYRAPYDGRFRFGLFDERRVRGALRGDVNRDGNPPGSSGLFGILWDEATDEIRVDTRQDFDFTNERPLRPYGVRQDVGVFGVEDPSTPERETVGFGVQIDQAREYVALLLGASSHASGTVGVAGANRLFGGEASAAAPNVRLVPIAASGGGLAYLLEGLLLAARHPEVDLITSQIGTSGLGVGDGRDALTILADRIIAYYGKPFLTSAGNQGVVARLAGSDRIMGVGGYQHRDSWYHVYGTRVPNEHNILYASSYGPGGRGLLKPDFIAPSGVLSLYPRMLGSGPQRSAYPMPIGYQAFAGTSTASPMAASAAALLISAAKQTGVAYDPARIRDALRSTAWFVPGLDAYRQGVGLIHVPAAWDRLRHTAGGPVEEIQVSGPVRTALSGFLDPAHEGFGIHEQVGWQPGARGERTLRLKRTSGPPQSLTYALTWSGDTLSFSSADSVTLPLGETVAVPVEIRTDAAGMHSAILSLHRPGVPGSVHQVMNVVAAARPFLAEAEFQVELGSTVDRPGQRLEYLAVEPGTASLRFDLHTDEGVERALVTYSPTGGFGWPLHTRVHDHWLRTYVDPEPGAWELIVRDMWRDSWGPDTTQAGVVPPTPFTLRASIREVGLQVVDTEPLTVRATNRLAPFTGALAGGPLASTRRVARNIVAGEQHLYELEVPDGATLLHVRLAAAATPASDLDLYLYDCTGEQCSLTARSAALGAVESAWIRYPAPGRWRVVVDAHAVAGDSAVGYDYLDVVTDPRLGTVKVEDAPQLRGSGSSWTARAVPRASGHGATGRETKILIVVREHEPRAELIQFDPSEGPRRMLDVVGSVLIPLEPEAGALPYDLAFDMREFPWSTVLAVAPDARRVAYAVQQRPADMNLDARFMPNGSPGSVVGARVHITDRETSQTVDVCPGGNCWRPAWSPDGRTLAFYSDVDGPPQLWVYDLDAASARKVSPARVKAKLWAGDEAQWSADGRTLFVPLAPDSGPGAWLPVGPETGSTEPPRGPTVTVLRGGSAAVDEEEQERTTPLMEHYLRENNAAMAAVDLATGQVRVLAPAEADPRPSVLRLSPSGRWLTYLSVFQDHGLTTQRSTMDLAIVPTGGGTIRTVASELPLLGDYHRVNYSWHPTQDRLVYMSDQKLWLVDVGRTGPGSPRHLGAGLGPLAPTTHWFTRDGRAVVVGTDPVDERAYGDPRALELAVVPLDGSSPTRVPLPAGWTYQNILKADARTVWEPEAGSLTVLMTEEATGERGIIRVDIQTGQSRVLWQGRARLSNLTSGGSHEFMAGMYQDITTPPNVYRFASDFSTLERLSHIDPRLDAVGAGTVEVFETAVPLHDGELGKVRTVVILPPGAQRGDRLPALVVIYPGSDRTAYAELFGGGGGLTVPNLLFTSRGYAVVLTHARLGPNRETGNPLQELVDVVLPQVYRAAELGYVDVERLAVGGQSYGGYGTAAIVSGTNLFRAAIAVSGIYDLPGTYGHLDERGGSFWIGWLEGGQARMGTHPWASLHRYLDNSPYYRADRIFTPLLIVHGEEDMAYHDGMKLFSALRRLERPVVFARYGGQGHVVSQWSRPNAMDAAERMVEFVRRHLGDPGEPPVRRTPPPDPIGRP